MMESKSIADREVASVLLLTLEISESELEVDVKWEFGQVLKIYYLLGGFRRVCHRQWATLKEKRFLCDKGSAELFDQLAHVPTIDR